MARFNSINDIVNQVALEVGLTPVANVFSTQDASFAQLIGLANAVGRELLSAVDWQQLNKSYQVTTTDTDDGKYDLPSDFSYMIDQTGWERTSNVPLFGPLTAQTWTYLLGRDLVSSTIYASFRLNEQQLWVFPTDVPEGLDINFEYICRNWVEKQTDPKTYVEMCTESSDIVMYEPLLFERGLKAAFLDAKGFDTTTADTNFANQLSSWKGKGKSAPILNAGAPRRGVPLLDAYCNVPDTGYGRS